MPMRSRIDGVLEAVPAINNGSAEWRIAQLTYFG